MWIQAAALLLACCLWPADAQSDRRQSIWEDPIQFNTKAKDLCTMVITGQGEYTKMRLSCQSRKRSYWCEYIGRPYTCSSYNKNPRHYFVQMMWTLRKLHNACEAPREIKPHMCRKAADDTQMVFSAGSFSRPLQDASPRTAARSAGGQSPRQPATKANRVPQRVKPTQRAGPRPTTPPVESSGKRIARLYCWRSLQGICSVVVGWFRN